MAKTNFELIFLNNGDAVLQTDDYAAVFDGNHIPQLAECAYLLIEGGSTQSWEGHDSAWRIDTESEAFHEGLRNGNFQHFSSDYVSTYKIWDHSESSWGNVSEFVHELGHCLKQADWDALADERPF